MNLSKHAETIANLVHEQSVDILNEVGFCVPDQEVLSRLGSVGFEIDIDSEMVRISSDLLDSALASLPKDLIFWSVMIFFHGGFKNF